MKRELAYAKGAQSHVAEPLGRTRRSKSLPENQRSHQPDDNSPSPRAGVRVFYKRSKKPNADASNTSAGGTLGLEDSRSEFEIGGEDQTEGEVVISTEPKGNLVIETGEAEMEEAKKNEMVEVEVWQDSIACLDKSNNKPRRFTRSALKATVVDVEVEVEMEDKEMANGDLGEFKDALVLESELDENETVDVVGKLEMKMSKKIEIKGRPTTVRELFETGLLEGYPVFYNGGNKVWC